MGLRGTGHIRAGDLFPGDLRGLLRGQLEVSRFGLANVLARNLIGKRRVLCPAFFLEQNEAMKPVLSPAVGLMIKPCLALLILLCLLLCSTALQAQSGGTDGAYDSDAAIGTSQAAIGRNLDDFLLYDQQGRPVQLSNYRGRPLLVSMIFTSCHHVCPAITRHLAAAVDAAREALGEDSFQVLTIGFDTAVDTPDAMRVFAAKQDVDDPDWAFLSGSAEVMEQLVDNIGFVYFPSPRGFDHINQVTLIDREGVIYRQVYGAAFDLPWLVEPLKELVYNRPRPGAHLGAGLLNRIKLFCTVYDPNTGRYTFDYSLFVGIGVGAVIVLSLIIWLLMEFSPGRRKKKPA
jgi:protein SCO1/2